MKSFRQFNEAKMKTLYVHRPLKNGDDLKDWAKDHLGCETLQADDMHVTIANSKAELDWSQFKPKDDEIEIAVEGLIPQPLGDKGAVVLKFVSDELEARWQEFLDDGASWDYEGYQPHVTLTYKYEGDLETLGEIGSFSGVFVLGPEKFGEVDLEWTEKIKED